VKLTEGPGKAQCCYYYDCLRTSWHRAQTLQGIHPLLSEHGWHTNNNGAQIKGENERATTKEKTEAQINNSSLNLFLGPLVLSVAVFADIIFDTETRDASAIIVISLSLSMSSRVSPLHSPLLLFACFPACKNSYDSCTCVSSCSASQFAVLALCRCGSRFNATHTSNYSLR